MAEVFRSTLSGETTQHFVQFLVMYKQQCLLALGLHPSAPAGAPPPNLALGRAFVLQLAAIRERTKGNLAPEEEKLMEHTLSTLEEGYKTVSHEPLS